MSFARAVPLLLNGVRKRLRHDRHGGAEAERHVALRGEVDLHEIRQPALGGQARVARPAEE